MGFLFFFLINYIIDKLNKLLIYLWYGLLKEEVGILEVKFFGFSKKEFLEDVDFSVIDYYVFKVYIIKVNFFIDINVMSD